MNDSRRTAEGTHNRFADRIRMKYGAAGRGLAVIPLPSLIWLAGRGRDGDGGGAQNVPVVVHQDARTFVYHVRPADAALEGKSHSKQRESSGAIKGNQSNASYAPIRSFYERLLTRAGLPLSSRRFGARESSAASVWTGAATGLTKSLAGLTGLRPLGRLRAEPVSAADRLSGRQSLFPISAGPLASLSSAADFAARMARISGTVAGSSRVGAVVRVQGAAGMRQEAEQVTWLPSGIGRRLIAKAAIGAGLPVPERLAAEEAVAAPSRKTPPLLQTHREATLTGAAAPELVVAQAPSAAAAARSETSEPSIDPKPAAITRRGPTSSLEEQNVMTPVTLPPAEIERLSDRVYRELERRLKIEKQRLGL
ncbi:MAG: hypothetical protein ACQEXQ_01665 [Bacillota bacterium]